MMEKPCDGLVSSPGWIPSDSEADWIIFRRSCMSHCRRLCHVVIGSAHSEREMGMKREGTRLISEERFLVMRMDMAGHTKTELI